MIYLVEDDAGIRELVIYTLKNTGFDAIGFASARDFWQAMREHLPLLVMLDIMLPDEDGLTILKKLRAAPTTSRLPVIMLTAKGSEYDKVLGLDSGADDYLPKPFGMMELVARVRGLLRRTVAESTAQEFRVGDLHLSIPRHTVTVNNKEIALTLKEFELLHYLLCNKGLVVSRDQILSSVWGYDFNGETRTVDVHIRSLRSKLGSAGEVIQTVRGVGYKIGEER